MATIRAHGGSKVAEARRERSAADLFPPESYAHGTIIDVLILTSDGRVLKRVVFPPHRYAPRRSDSTGYRLVGTVRTVPDDRRPSAFARYASRHGYNVVP